MEQLIFVLVKFLPVLLLILLGMLLRRIHLIRPETVSDLKAIIVNLSLPAMLFLTFARTDFQAQYFYIVLAVIGVCFLMLFLGLAFSRWLAPKNPYFPAVFTGFEAGMLGYALFTAFFGGENTYKFAIVDIGQVCFVFFVLVSFLQRQKGAKASPGALFLSFARSPIILAILAGILLSVLGLTQQLAALQITEAAVSTLDLLASLTAPLICLVIGYELRLQKTGLLRPLLTVLLRMGLMLTLAYLLNRYLVLGYLGLDKSFAWALYTMFLTPPPFVIPIYMDDASEGERTEILNVLSIHIIMTLAAFFILTATVGGL